VDAARGIVKCEDSRSIVQNTTKIYRAGTIVNDTAHTCSNEIAVQLKDAGIDNIDIAVIAPGTVRDKGTCISGNHIIINKVSNP